MKHKRLFSPDGWDIVIVDDIPTFEQLKHIRPRHKVWYIHGTYHTWKEFQKFANREFTRMHVLFPDVSRKSHILSWYKNPILSELILPIHPTQQIFSDKEGAREAVTKRNGRVYAMGNNFVPAASLYSDKTVILDVLQKLQKLPFDMYGFNNPPPVPEPFFKGSAANIKETAKHYSASVHPSRVETMSFVLLESLAAGVPVITTPKCDLPLDLSGESYFIETDNDSMIKRAESLIQDEALSLEIGRGGQQFLRERLPFSNYRERLTRWIESII